MRFNPKHTKKNIVYVHTRPINLRQKIESATFYTAIFSSPAYIWECKEERQIIIEIKKPVIMLRSSNMILDALEPSFVSLIEADYIFEKDVIEVLPLLRKWILNKYGSDALKRLMMTDAFVNQSYNAKSIIKNAKGVKHD